MSHGDLVQRFGKGVADGVLALSKRPDFPKSEAMADSLGRIRAQPSEVWCVKLADRITNMRSVPAHWPAEKAAEYRAEAQVILDALGSAHPVLQGRLRHFIGSYPG